MHIIQHEEDAHDEKQADKDCEEGDGVYFDK